MTEEPFDTDLLEYDAYKPTGYPVRHKKKVPFKPYPSLPRGYRERCNAISDMDRELNSIMLSSEDYYQLVVDAYSSNTHWSTAIEGNPLSEEEVNRLTRHFTVGQIKEKQNGPSQEILNHLYPLFKNLDPDVWNLDFSGRIHAMLLKDTGYQEDLYAIRTKEVSIVGTDGFEYFIACPHDHIESEMNSLFQWLEGSPYDPICTAALFFHEFESIHPYADGNGRTGRVLFQMLLQKLGLKYCGLCKFEYQLLKDKERYYTLLAYTDQSGDYAPFVSYVTDALAKAYSEAIKTFSQKDHLKNADEAIRTIALMAKKHRRFTSKDAASWVHSCKLSTVLKHITFLIDIGILRKEGSGRSTRYVFDDPFEQIRRELGNIEDDI